MPLGCTRACDFSQCPLTWILVVGFPDQPKSLKERVQSTRIMCHFLFASDLCAVSTSFCMEERIEKSGKDKKKKKKNTKKKNKKNQVGCGNVVCFVCYDDMFTLFCFFVFFFVCFCCDLAIVRLSFP